MHRSIMTMKMACTSVAALVMGSGMAFADCKPAHEFTTITPGVLTVAVTSYPPSSHIDDTGAAKGYDNDILAEFARRECLEVRSVAVDPAAAIQYVLSGQADLSTGSWYRTAERAKVMSLSAPIYKDQMGVYSKDGFSALTEFEGQPIGTVQGYNWVSDVREIFGQNLKLYPSSVSLQQDLKIGRIVAGLDGYASGAYAEQQGALEGLKARVIAADTRVKATTALPQVGYPYHKRATEFGAALDADIAAMHADGTISKILTGYGLSADAADVGAPTLIQ